MTKDKSLLAVQVREVFLFMFVKDDLYANYKKDIAFFSALACVPGSFQAFLPGAA